MFKKWKKYFLKIGVNYYIIYYIMSIVDILWYIDLIYWLWNNSIFYYLLNSKMLRKWYKLYEMKVFLENNVFYLMVFLICFSLKRVVIIVNYK